jgi:hypothetical protein
MGRSTGDLHQLVAEQGLYYLGLETDDMRGEHGSHPEIIFQFYFTLFF